MSDYLNLFNPLFPLDFFPCRVGSRKVSARIMDKGGIAAGCFDPESGVAHIPVGTRAYDRAVRRHEATHAIVPAGDIRMTALFQGVEDMRIHVFGQSGHNDGSRRDELVMALHDLRDAAKNIDKIKMLDETQARIALVPTARALAILHYGLTHERGFSKPNSEARIKKMIAKVVATFEKRLKKTGLLEAIDNACVALESDNMNAAYKAMKSFLTLNKEKDAELPKQKQQQQQKSKQKQNKPDDKKSPNPSLSADDEDEDESEEEQKKENKEKKSKDEKSEDKTESKEDKSETKDDKKSKGSDESDEESEDSGDEESDESSEDSDEDAEGSGDSDEPFEDDPDNDIPCSENDIASQQGKKGGVGMDSSMQDALEDGRLTAESVSLLDPETLKELLEAGSAGYSRPLPKMKIEKLDYRMSKKITQGRSERLANSGMRIRLSRIPRIFDPKPGKIFERTGQQKGGTVLIDASGSMNLEDERLAKLAERIPIGQVAYYAGSWAAHSAFNGCHGGLTIYSKDGRSYMLKAGERLPGTSIGGNEVDFQALQWLLKQPAPRWFISDLEFCGSSDASNNGAMELAKKAYQRNLIKFHMTLSHLEIELNLKTELDEPDAMMQHARGGEDGLLKILAKCEVCSSYGQIRATEGSWNWNKCPACSGKGYISKRN